MHPDLTPYLPGTTHVQDTRRIRGPRPVGAFDEILERRLDPEMVTGGEQGLIREGAPQALARLCESYWSPLDLIAGAGTGHQWAILVRERIS
jgi:hypothetical protein